MIKLSDVHKRGRHCVCVVLAGWLGKDIEYATKNDIIELVQKIKQTVYKEWTKLNYKWLREDGSYPEETRWVLKSSKIS